MEKGSEKKDYLFDTSALISLGVINLIDLVFEMTGIIITPSVLKELEEFAKFDDAYGKASKEVIRNKEKLIVRDAGGKEPTNHIQSTDNELFYLAKEQSLTMITDDIKFSRHVDGKVDTLFSTFFLTSLVSSGHLPKEKAIDLLEKLRTLRNWRNNIIYLTMKQELERL
ncbi:hypothetical protein HYV84_04340 [Candidatus Woesearchaeota archaeon]|nr:hypothetical protein [Candidatus Woesearchaeota archaeon]